MALVRTHCLHWIKCILAVTACLSLSCCKVGPNFKPPAPPATNKYTALPLPQRTTQVSSAGHAGVAQNFIQGRDISGQWWTLFHSARLNILIKEGIKNNPTLAAARAALTKARQLLRAQVGESYYPSVGLDLDARRLKISNVNIGSDTGSTFSLYTAQANATYLLDFFGKQRRLVESVRAELDYQRYEMLAAYLTLTTNIAANYISIASIQSQIKTTLQLIQEQTDILKITRQQYQVGGVSEADVIAQETLLAQTKATLPPLQDSLAQTIHALAILVGKPPSKFIAKRYSLDALKLPRQLPIILPSFLVRQRPDILASQALLHKASAEVGIATANLYPEITLTANFGYISDTLSKFFTTNNNIWNYGLELLQPIFEGGSLIAKKRAAVAAFQQSFAEYRETVLEAFKETSDALRLIQFNANEFLQQYRAERSAASTLKITLDQFKVGGANYLNVLNAQEQYQQNKLNRIKAQAARYTDTVLLFQALGGGWWHNPINIQSLEIAGMQKPRLPQPAASLPSTNAEQKNLPLPKRSRV